MARCLTCKRELDVPGDPASQDCGGDCLRCLADCDDPDALRTLWRIEKEKVAMAGIKPKMYIGWDTRLKGRTALVERDGSAGLVRAQFDYVKGVPFEDQLEECFGWHTFMAEDFIDLE